MLNYDLRSLSTDSKLTQNGLQTNLVRVRHTEDTLKCILYGSATPKLLQCKNRFLRKLTLDGATLQRYNRA
jgi:hypothetical protein